MKRLWLSAIATLALLSACEARKEVAPDHNGAASVPSSPSAPRPQAADASAANFQHDPKLDAFGYYFSDPTVRFGKWELSSLNIGGPEEFAAWEDGKRPNNFAPIFLEFEDVTSPTAQNELGQSYHTISFRLLPESYRVDSQEVVFRAKDARFGEVVFSGVFDLEALKAAKAGDPGGDDKIVLKGALRIGAEGLRNISFSYFGGD